jgi:hypothetical protein
LRASSVRADGGWRGGREEGNGSGCCCRGERGREGG